MQTGKILGISVLGLLWLWLAYYVLASKFTLITLFWVAASGIIIFVPLYKKYFKSSDKK